MKKITQSYYLYMYMWLSMRKCDTLLYLLCIIWIRHSLQASIAFTHRQSHVHVQIVALGYFLHCFSPKERSALKISRPRYISAHKKKSSTIYRGPKNLLCNRINWVSRIEEQFISLHTCCCLARILRCSLLIINHTFIIANRVTLLK
jgi:hypothetical protein